MSLLDDGMGVCQRPANRSRADWISPWEGRLDYEKTPVLEQRHHRARVLCQRCPALAECEDRLAQFEREGLPVDGVVAGRYCDVAQVNREYQSHCAGCGKRLLAQAGKKLRAGQVHHVGEGLCTECYPILRRRT